MSSKDRQSTRRSQPALSPCRILFCNQKPALLCAQNYPVLCYQYYDSNLLCIIDFIVTADITNEGEEDEEDEEEEG